MRGNWVAYGGIVVVVALLALGCDYPYQPQAAQASTTTTTATLDNGTIVSINTGRQICNASISQDTVDFAGCMLWLNFKDQLNVSIAPGLSGPGYSTIAPRQHDRLTVSDYTNTVRWYLFNTELGLAASTELQDPEWSTHPDYVLTLAKRTLAEYDGYVVSVKDKSRFLKFNDNGLTNISTPHLWVGGPSAPPPPSSAARDAQGFVSKEAIYDFFGTCNVKFVFVLRNGGQDNYRIHYIDYSQESPHMLPLKKPAAFAGNRVENPLFDPQGNFVVYDASVNDYTDGYRSFIHYLDSAATPVALSSGTAAEPHWYHSPVSGLLYVLYSTKGHSVSADLTKVTDGSAGQTLSRRVALNPAGRVNNARIELVDEPKLFVNAPMKGGISPDGRFMATGYDNAFMFIFN
jgi:hypothetical protein